MTPVLWGQGSSGDEGALGTAVGMFAQQCDCAFNDPVYTQ